MNNLWKRRLVQTLSLTRANLKSRYRKTLAGFIWVVLNPLILYGVQSYVFGKVVRIPMHHYWLFLLSGLLPWIFISQTLEMCTSIFLGSARLLKSYAVHPLVYLSAQVMDNLFSFSASFLVIFIPSLFFVPKLKLVLLLPIPVLILISGTFGLAWFLATIQVFLRDTKFLVSFCLSFMFYLTPVLYPTSFVPDDWQWTLRINPFHHLILPFRDVLYDFSPMRFVQDCVHGAIVSLLFLTAAFLFWGEKAE